MNNVYKGKAKYILAPVVILLLITSALTSNGNRFFSRQQFSINDTLPPVLTKPDSAKALTSEDITDSIEKRISTQKNLTDTIVKIKADTLNIKVSKDSLDAPVVYHADDSVVLDVPSKKVILYCKDSKTTYKDNELTAPGIVFDQGKNIVTASLKKDSLGNVIAYPVYKQKELLMVSDTIAFNMKSGKGLTKGTYTKQGEMFVYGEKIKKVSPDVFFAYRARITTCNLDTPHFSFVSNKIKFINKKFAITGPVHPEFEGVPIPIYLPFGIFPLIQGRHSGLIAPVFTVSQQLGIALQGIGYYKVLSDDWDVTTTGTLYSYGSWEARISPHYYKRYHYRGSFSLDYLYTKLNFKGDPDYSVTKGFNILWNHSMDSKARPGVTFAANVNVTSSSGYNAAVPNNPYLNFQNQLASTIQYAKVWKDKPFNISLTANQNQNSVTKTFDITLPNVAFNVNTLYPFRRKEVIGNLKWYENIGIALNSDAQSLTSYSDDSTLLTRTSIGQQISKNLQWGANHSVPISLSLPQIGPLQIAPTVSYQERWYEQKTFQSWDNRYRILDTTIQRGFYSARSMSFGVGLSTRIFGQATFGKNSKIQAIHHEIRPFINFSYVPDMNSQYYYNLRYDSAGDIRRASVFDGSLYGGAFSETKFAGLNFGVDNNIQMKIRNDKDTGANAVKKITLIDGLSIGGSYNFLLDSFALSLLNVSARSSLFNNKLNVTASAILDPYQVNAQGHDINTLVWKQDLLTLGRLTSGTISLSTQFQGGDKKNKGPNASGQNLNNLPYNPGSGLPQDQFQSELAYISNNPAEYTNFNIPWSVNFAYSLSYNKTQNATLTGLTSTISQYVSGNGTLGLSAKWQLGLNASYNITQGQLGMLSLTLAREMHCWQMAISISPVGTYRFFSITLSPKSGLLRDLRINRSRSFYSL